MSFDVYKYLFETSHRDQSTNEQDHPKQPSIYQIHSITNSDRTEFIELVSVTKNVIAEYGVSK